MNKKILLMAVFCFLLNILNYTGEVEASIIVSSPAVQASVCGAICFARLPFTVMSDILQGIPLLPEYSQPTKGAAKNHKHNNDSRDSKYIYIPNLVKEVGTIQKIECGKAGGGVACMSTADTGFRSTDFSPRWPGFVSLFLLTYMVPLSRNNLPGETISFIFGKTQSSILIG